MADLKLKNDVKDKYIAFGNNTKKLGEKSPEDLVELAMIARSSNDQSLIDLFDGELPALADLQEEHSANLQKRASLNKPAAKKEKPASPNTTQPNTNTGNTGTGAGGTSVGAPR